MTAYETIIKALEDRKHITVKDKDGMTLAGFQPSGKELWSVHLFGRAHVRVKGLELKASDLKDGRVVFEADAPHGGYAFADWVMDPSDRVEVEE